METLHEKRDRVAEIIAVLEKFYPGAKLELDFSNPLELLIALILAAQARDDLVNTVTPSLFKKYKNPADWAAANPETLQAELGKISFFRQKTRSIQNACRVMEEKFGGKVPDKYNDLLTLPGVGRKTANVLLGNAFGQPAIGVDRHVARVSDRLGLTQKTDPDKIEGDLAEIVVKENQVKFCHLLQIHGRRICIAKKPKCPECPVNPLCFYLLKTSS